MLKTVMSRLEKIIVDTDAGGDPDDTLAIALASKLPNILAFVSSDETGDGKRAEVVRAIVGGRAPVFTGLSSPYPGTHVLDQLHIPPTLHPESVDDGFLDLINHAAQDSSLLWVGIGSYTNLAWLHDKNPELAESMRVVLMGGRMNMKEGDRPEHNFKVDPEAAMSVATSFPHLTYVPATTTMHERVRVDVSHPLISYLARGNEPWQAASLENFNVWFERRFDASYQHDALTLAIALGAVRNLSLTRVRAARDGGLSEDETCRALAVSGGVEHDAFWQWVWNVLDASPESIQKDQS